MHPVAQPQRRTGRVDTVGVAGVDDILQWKAHARVPGGQRGFVVSQRPDTLQGQVRVDAGTVPQKVADILGERMVDAGDPCALPKARKNAAEIEGSAEAHLRDGAAIVELLCWLDAQKPGSLTETQVVSELEARRRTDNALQDISFETISGTGPNGAIMHYRVTEETDSTLEDGHLLVLDSGGQYLDGTTDITRTMAIGTPSPECIRAFTLVLKGMIAISMARWPKGLGGRDLDPLARMALWQNGMDFDHGTGHGVGVYLSVHEGPQRLSRASTLPFEPGMILSNEPGYYAPGHFGIRIENLVVVEPAPDLPGGDNRDMLQFETLTWVPIDKRLIDPDLLTTAETTWLNNYHAKTQELLFDSCSPAARSWLKSACAPL